MKTERPSYVVPLLAGFLVLLPVLVWMLLWEKPLEPTALPPIAVPKLAPRPVAAEAANPASDRKALVEQFRAALQRRMELPDARTKEAVLTFKNEEAYRKFIDRAAKAGLRVLGRLDALYTARVGYDSLDDLMRDITDHAADYSAVNANLVMRVPLVPAPEDRTAINQIPFRDSMLAFLGVTGDTSAWGRGVTIAILDSGIAPDAAFGQGRVRSLDLGQGLSVGTGVDDGHGTAVAALAAGAGADARGVAPAAGLLSIRVTGADGTSDTFTVSQAIIAAVDAGARVINLSMGSYYDSILLTRAIDYATEHGSVIVAAAGNDQAAQLVWPAADPRVISVGAVDALGQQVMFSNSGEQLKLTAPGYGVDTVWLGGQRVAMDGTSASAPIVAGAIAALMSENPGLSAAQAAFILEQYASEGGAIGNDPAYGHGILNVGWAMDRNDTARVDTAIASQSFDPIEGTMELVVQNRSGRAMAGLELDVDAGGTHTPYPVPLLAPGATYVVQASIDVSRLDADGGMVVRTELKNPAGIEDQMPANNRRATLIAPSRE